MAHLAHHIAGKSQDMLNVKLVKCDLVLYLSRAVQIFFNARQISNKVHSGFFGVGIFSSYVHGDIHLEYQRKNKNKNTIGIKIYLKKIVIQIQKNT